MLVELRTYQLPASRMRDYLAIYEAKGLTVQREALGRLVGCYTTEIGALNEVIFLWEYASFEDRTARRAKLAMLPEWQAYVAEVGPLFVHQESRLLLPAAFTSAS